MAAPDTDRATPKAFITYSWDDDPHTEWVKSFAIQLTTHGVDVTLDLWHSGPGEQIPAFMERAVRNNDFVIAVCTPRFKERFDARTGGVGYEGDIISALTLTSAYQKKVIPVLRRGKWTEAAPTWLVGMAYIDLSADPYSKKHYLELLRTLYKAREGPPPIGHAPPELWEKSVSHASPSQSPATPQAASSALEVELPVTALPHGARSPHTPFRILGETVDSPIRCSLKLNFADEDKRMYPWLDRDDRYYTLGRPLGPGGFSIPILGHPSDSRGNPVPDAPAVVIKFPNLDAADRFTTKQRDDRTAYIRRQSIREWHHVRKRLITGECKHANPILDLGTHSISHQDEITDIYVTVQRFIADDVAVPLKTWLENRGLKPRSSSGNGAPDLDNWAGVSKPNDWLFAADLIARGLADLHRCRVIHGDIWPPNVFVTSTANPFVIFIDFGESFTATPTGDLKMVQRDHPYRAPERRGAAYAPAEQVDVYSFGKLLLYLAIGVDRWVAPKLEGHDRRAFIRNEILTRNPALVKAVPAIVDVIARCTALDPVTRPRMTEVSEDLADIAAELDTRPNHDPRLQERLSTIADKALSRASQHSSIFTRFLETKISEIEHLIETSQTEMIELSGTRDRLIRALIVLFHELQKNDSWTCITTPSVWQDRALGLDGRYATATINALRRDASVHRTFIVSIEELGVRWASQLVRKLEEAKDCEPLRQLAVRFGAAIAEFNTVKKNPNYKRLGDSFETEHRKRFVAVAESLRNMIVNWDLGGRVTPDKFTSIRETKGLYVGLSPVSSLTDVWVRRAENPASLMYTATDDEANRWILVMTDMRGRNETEPGTGGPPELRGIKIFKSALGKPADRISGLEDIMRDDSVNIGAVIERFARCIAAV
jgi:serine/threonine protein kinase